MDAPELAEDPRFARLDARLSNHDELGDAIARWTSGLDRYEAARRLQDAGVSQPRRCSIAARTHTTTRTCRLETTSSRLLTPRPARTCSAARCGSCQAKDEPRHDPAPGLGEHNSYVLRDLLGVTDAAYAELEHELVIGDTPLEGSDMGGVRRVRREAARRAG